MKTRTYVALLLLLSGCATWPATHEAGVRRSAVWRLQQCMKGPGFPPDVAARCRAESEAYCVSEGLERTCGYEWSTP